MPSPENLSYDNRPIGVFDSGIGGLTVLKSLLKHFPNENFIYLGDTARLPYGSKSPSTIRKYAEQNVQYLTNQDVKLIVIACNSASTQMRESQFRELPLYNVITPGAFVAVKSSECARIGLIGTRATVSSRAYEIEILKLNPQAQVFSMACPLLVPLAEEGWDQDPITNMIVYRYLQVLMSENIDTLILGCTHYPLLSQSISRVTGTSIQLIDSGEAISLQMKEDIKGNVWKQTNGAGGALKICLTDESAAFRGLAQNILSTHQLDFEIVNLTLPGNTKRPTGET